MQTVAEHIVEKLGGVAETAALAGVSRFAVWRWLRPEGQSGGLGGDVPRPAKRKLLRNARARGIDLTEADFIPQQIRRAS